MESHVRAEDRFVDPEEVTRTVGVHSGMRIADIGAGSGAYTFACAKKVGDTGRVYAIDVQSDFLTRISNEAEGRGIDNIEIVWGDAERHLGTKLAGASIDMALLSNILFQFEVKEDALKEVHRILKPEGTLVIVEWSDSFNGMGPATSDVVARDDAKSLADRAGFALVREFTPGKHHYGLIYTKAKTI